jgi:hypothetical protein
MTDLHVEVDGVALHNLFDYRGTSGLFRFAADPSLQQGFDSCILGTPQPFASDGYWIMLAPLRVGAHTLHFSGQATFFGYPFGVDQSYNLRVTPRGRGRGEEADATPGAVEQKTWGLVKGIYRR